MTKIMFVISRMDVGGAEQIFRELAIGLARGGKFYDVTLVCLYERGRLAEGLDEKGVRVYEGVMKDRFDIAGFLRFIGILRKVRPDILYTAGQILSQAAAAAGAIFVKIPVKIIGFHSHDLAHRPLYKLFIDKISILSADKIVCVSESQKRHIVINKKLKPEMVKVIHNGVDISRFKPGKKTVDRDRVIIGRVGSLRKEKGLDVLLSAAPEVLRCCPSAYFLIVGDGSENGMLQELAKKLGISKSVDFLGERNDVEKIIPSFDIACSSSRTENFPVSMLEYMSCGKGIVATAVGGVPEIIKDRVNGLLVKSECPEDLAEKLIYMIENKELRESMGMNGRRMAEECFTLDKMVENYKEFFKEMQK